MSYYAKIDENNTVTEVIAADQAFIDSGAVGEAAQWLLTDRNTSKNIHYSDSGEADNGTPFRKNHAEVGGTYDLARDAFIPIRIEYPSFILSEETCTWVAPIPLPYNIELEQSVAKYWKWSEEIYASDNTQGWVMMTETAPE